MRELLILLFCLIAVGALEGTRQLLRWSKERRGSELLAGFCYTQFADTYQEANGLLYADRTPKFPIEQIAEATRGSTRRTHVAATPDPQAGSAEAATRD